MLFLSYEVANFKFGRITEGFLPNYTEFDRSGILEERGIF